MNLGRHFESYRASLKHDALSGFDEYAAAVPTAKPDQFPKTIDYLRYAFKNVTDAIQKNSEKDYVLWVSRHQGAMLALFDRMVEDHLWDYVNTTPDSLFDMIQHLGWNWYKFCRLPILLKIRTPFKGGEEQLVNLAFIPRYAAQFKESWTTPGLVALDADEGAIFFDGKKSPELTHPVLEFKLANPGQKLLRIDMSRAENQCYYKPVSSLNDKDVVVDWSLPLF